MKLSFYDEESFKEAVGSFCFSNSPSDPHTLHRTVPPQDSEKSEDICFINPPSDPSILRQVESSSSVVEP